MNQAEKNRVADDLKKEDAVRMEQTPVLQPKHLHLRKWAWAPAAAVLLAGVLVLIPIVKPTTVQARENLMEGVSAQKQEVPQAPGADFISAQADFAVKLLRKTTAKGKNTLISPTSVALALGMTENGAKGNTLSQFEALLGGRMNLDALNKAFASERAVLKSTAGGKFLLANSIWYRDKNMTVKRQFLQANADFFGAGAFQLDFSGPATPEKINSWVSQNTDGKIDKMVEKIGPSDMMYLINTLYLEQDWKIPYDGSTDSVFHAPGGDQTVKMMDSSETYLHAENAQGILKPLKDVRFAFVAILPDEKPLAEYPNSGALLDDYVAGFTCDKLLNLLRSAGNDHTSAFLPKFKFACDLTLNDALISLGLSDAFDGSKADFSAMGSTSSDGNLYIKDVLHKTFIEVDELGIKAGAATKATIAVSSAPVKPLVFDRPFLIAVVDTQTMLPVFLGTVSDPSGG